MLTVITLLIMVVEAIARPTQIPTQNPEALRLAAGVQVMAPRKISDREAYQIALAAIETTQITDSNGNKPYQWIEPVDLLGLAGAESDFRPWLVAENGKPDPNGWDCGITQARVTIFAGGRTRKARKLCNRITKSARTGFEYAARELTNYRNRRGYCKKHIGKGTPWKLKRCILNSHKSGPRYCRTGRCGRYWLRVHCFRMGVRLQSRPRMRGARVSCRNAQSLKWIWRAYR